MSARERVPRGSVSGPTHGSAPTDSIETSLNPGRSGRGQSPAPTGLSWCQVAGRCGHRPLRKGRKVSATTRASGAERSVCGADGRSGWESEQRSSPKVSSNPGQSLSHGEAVTAPFTQGSLRDGGCGLPRRPVGPPRNDKGFLSFRGAERRGNPFLFTMDGGSGRRVVGPYGRSTEVPATGRCRHRPLRKGEKAVSTTRGSAPSAERAAGQI